MNRFSTSIILIILSLSFALSVRAQTVTKIDGAGLRKLLPDKENKKTVLINFWATWCGPCRVEFPELVEIDKDFRAKGLEVKLVSVDNFALIDSLVPEFLEQYEAANISAYLLDIPSDFQRLRAIRRIAPPVRSGIPLTLLYNANGKLVYRKSGVIDAAILRKQIEKTLGK
ncbi:MAG TPA: TlpA disulfide reductase family protein [Pyrinomonadaceae bacterium]|nr:TlpA disulfide reductase family protein [Pyrinomonadaceae bacterium]